MSVPPSNVKVYDRPERKGPSPVVLVVVLLVVAIVGFFLYRALHHASPTAPVNAQPGIVLFSGVVPAKGFQGLPTSLGLFVRYTV